MKTKKPQREKKQPRKKGQAKRGEEPLSEASLDKVVGGVGSPRPRSIKKGGVADDSV